MAQKSPLISDKVMRVVRVGRDLPPIKAIRVGCLRSQAPDLPRTSPIKARDSRKLIRRSDALSLQSQQPESQLERRYDVEGWVLLMPREV